MWNPCRPCCPRWPCRLCRLRVLSQPLPMCRLALSKRCKPFAKCPIYRRYKPFRRPGPLCRPKTRCPPLRLSPPKMRIGTSSCHHNKQHKPPSRCCKPCLSAPRCCNPCKPNPKRNPSNPYSSPLVYPIVRKPSSKKKPKICASFFVCSIETIQSKLHLIISKPKKKKKPRKAATCLNMNCPSFTKTPFSKRCGSVSNVSKRKRKKKSSRSSKSVCNISKCSYCQRSKSSKSVREVLKSTKKKSPFYRPSSSGFCKSNPRTPANKKSSKSLCSYCEKNQIQEPKK